MLKHYFELPSPSLSIMAPQVSIDQKLSSCRHDTKALCAVTTFVFAIWLQPNQVRIHSFSMIILHFILGLLINKTLFILMLEYTFHTINDSDD